jgi:tetratricopeptide (TPR) repeat protein
MALSFYGWQNDQVYAASFLKPGGREDKNVNPVEIVAFVNSQSQLKALTRIGGNLDVLKALISNNIPVIIETGYFTEGSDWYGHYQTLVGYDDNLGQFYINDSNIGPNHVEDYDYLNTEWQQFNRRFIVIYRPQDETLVAGILGDLADPDKAAQTAFDLAQADAKEDSSNAFAWFNMGSSLVALGDYERAAAAYDKAQALGKLPWRMLWYQFGLFEAYYHMGRYDDVISYAEINLSTTGQYVEEAHYWLGMALEAQGKNTEAASAFRQALIHNPKYEAAQLALNELNNKS